ncbi:MAG: hypothetical protein CRU78_07185 [Candidatus Accumulibacter phosphatis]|uniref:Uncharacterized protein n=1 Tax=Candidatus Accumulibacter phosphatis TaxID=327160 RepID=A0A6A7RRY6_9PROT|nr:hypothetical protein [Candidatus Accumulibacter phosphatis]
MCLVTCSAQNNDDTARGSTVGEIDIVDFCLDGRHSTHTAPLLEGKTVPEVTFAQLIGLLKGGCVMFRGGGDAL